MFDWTSLTPTTSHATESRKTKLSEMVPIGEDVLRPARPRTRPIAVRFDDDTIRRLKSLAARRHKGYQSLLKEFVVERLYEEEKREGLVG